jgi:hypothetical protein
MPKKLDPNNPSNPSLAWWAMIGKWTMIETLLGGTAALRAAGETYLPKHEEESFKNYEERLMTNTLFNMLDLTLNAWVGKPFSDPIKLNDDMPDEIVEMTKDIDLQGNDINVFARNWFKEGLAKGLAHVLVDMPVLSEEEMEGRTKADDLTDGRRPYWCMIKPENLIFASAININGEMVLDHIRFKRVVTRRVDFLEEPVLQIVVIERGLFEIWEFVEPKDKRKKPEWIIIKQGETGVDFVPLVTFYAEQDGFMLTKPPTEDLAFLNIRHWQSSSDQNNILTVARFPMLAVSGATDQTGEQMKIGPRQLLGTKDPQGRFYYVEHTGKAINAGKEDLEVLEQQMAAYGAEFLRKKPGGLTATARALDSAEATSPLRDATVRFIDAIHSALSMTAKWIGQESGGTVDIPLDFGPEEIENADMLTLFSARKNRDLSRKDFLNELQRRGALMDEFDQDKNIEELENEKDFLPENDPAFNVAGEKVGGKSGGSEPRDETVTGERSDEPNGDKDSQ